MATRFPVTGLKEQRIQTGDPLLDVFYAVLQQAATEAQQQGPLAEDAALFLKDVLPERVAEQVREKLCSLGNGLR